MQTFSSSDHVHTTIKNGLKCPQCVQLDTKEYGYLNDILETYVLDVSVLIRNIINVWTVQVRLS